MKCQSTLNQQVRGDQNGVPSEFIWYEFFVKVYPALINWASIYGQKRHEQHLQHFRPRCAHCNLLGQDYEVCCRGIRMLFYRIVELFSGHCFSFSQTIIQMVRYYFTIVIKL